MAAQQIQSIDTKDATRLATEDIPEYSSESSDEFARNPFIDPKILAHYQDIYEKCQYECRHVLDPSLEWSHKEERQIVRKLDWHVSTWAVSKTKGYTWHDGVLMSPQCIMFFALNVDRKNLAQAVSDNMLNQLHLSTNGQLPAPSSRIKKLIWHRLQFWYVEFNCTCRKEA